MDAGADALLAEAVGWLLARELGAPVPEAATHGTGQHLSWLSRAVPYAGHWDQRRSPNLVNAYELGRMLTLDLVLLNEDRSDGNVLLESLDDGGSRAWAIDHGGALAGSIDDYERRVGEAPDATMHIRGLPVDVLEPHALAAAIVAGQLSEFTLRQIVLEAAMLVGRAGGTLVDRMTKSLHRQCGMAERLVPLYLEKVGAVR